MKPKKSPQDDPQRYLFRPQLSDFINLEHPLVKLSHTINWQRFDELFGGLFDDSKGRPGISTRLMVSLHYLKYTHNLSDEETVKLWLSNPYWQYFSGMKWFMHDKPIDPSSMTRWRNRMGKLAAEELLKETIESGLKLKAIKLVEMERINIDTTVQEKNIRFPTDARLYDRARERLVKEADKLGIKLRQHYNKKSKKVLLKYSRYSHAKQFKKANVCLRNLKTYLGRVIRDIERKCDFPTEAISSLLEIGKKILTQAKHDKNKVYSVHESAVECISKGKAHKRYEFGCKVSVAATSKGGWLVGAIALHGNPYDGNTLSEALEQLSNFEVKPKHVFVDRGYRGHGYQGEIQVHVDKQRRGGTAKSLWKWMKRRSAIEPTIGHLKSEHLMGRNRLKGVLGDHINAILSAAGMNFRKLMRWMEEVWRIFLFRLLLQEAYCLPLAA